MPRAPHSHGLATLTLTVLAAATSARSRLRRWPRARAARGLGLPGSPEAIAAYQAVVATIATPTMMPMTTAPPVGTPSVAHRPPANIPPTEPVTRALMIKDEPSTCSNPPRCRRNEYVDGRFRRSRRGARRGSLGRGCVDVGVAAPDAVHRDDEHHVLFGDREHADQRQQADSGQEAEDGQRGDREPRSEPGGLPSRPMVMRPADTSVR